jgi:hypothetical protein
MSVIKIVKVSVPDVGIAAADTVQTAALATAVGIVVVPDGSSLETEHTTAPDPEIMVAVIS